MTDGSRDTKSRPPAPAQVTRNYPRSSTTPLRVSSGYSAASRLPASQVWVPRASVIHLTCNRRCQMRAGKADARMGVGSWITTAWQAVRTVSLGGRWRGPGVICGDFGRTPAEKNGSAGATCQHLRGMGVKSSCEGTGIG